MEICYLAFTAYYFLFFLLIQPIPAAIPDATTATAAGPVSPATP